MIRIRRVSYFVQNLNVRRSIKALVNLLKLGLYMILVLHISACLWFNRTQLNTENIKQVDGERLQHWVPPYDFLNLNDMTIYGSSETQLKLYFIYFYHAVLFLNLNEVAPVNERELLFAVLILLFTSLVYTKMFSDIVVIIITTEKAKNLYQNKLDETLEVMTYIKMDFND